MQYISLPMISYMTSANTSPSIIQLLSFALSIDFTKFAFSVSLKQLVLVEKDQKKLELSETNISSSSLRDLGLENVNQKDQQLLHENRKYEDSFQKRVDAKHPHIQELLKKRESSRKARLQILQVIKDIKDKSNIEVLGISQKKGFKYIDEQESKSFIKQIKVLKKAKQIHKSRKPQKCQQYTNISPFISTCVSLIQTVDIVQNIIDRQQLERKKQSLLLRQYNEDDNLVRKYRKQNKRFN